MADNHDLVVERIFDVPRALAWKAWSNPEHLKRWWAPRPYETVECEMDLRAGGIFYTRMIGPDGFDSPGTGCFLEVVPGEKVVWTNVMLPGFRPADAIEDCGGFPFTAIVTFEDAGEGRTRYRAVAMHRNQADSDKHAGMGFQEGWGTCADQLAEVASELTERV